MKNMMERVAIAAVIAMSAAPLMAQEVTVLGSQEEILSLWESDNWWSEKESGRPLEVPYKMVVAITQRWQKKSPELPVATKKNIFYSSLLPLVIHANTMVLERRDRIQEADKKLAGGGALTAEEVDRLRDMAVLLRISSREEAGEMSEPAEYRQVLKEALYRLDVIPAGLVLGQAAYESGYATSRFAVAGNALFGQWTYGGEGLLPEQQREKLGDYRIASYAWPFDSVRDYFINLSSHPAYEDFRRIRAELKVSGKSVSSLALAEGLERYSERGQEYVDTLKGIIRSNDLEIADGAVFRDEPMSFIIGAEDQAEAQQLRKEIEAMRTSGELAVIVERMRLE